MMAAAPTSVRSVETDDAAYHRARAAEELEAAAHASCIVKDVHLELADLYTDQAAANFKTEVSAVING